MAEFRLITTQKEIERPILWNTDEVKGYVASVTSQFTNLTYTDEQEAEAQKDRANLNKLREALKKAKKNVKEQNEIPYTVFAKEVDEAIKMLDETIAHIDEQTAEMDAKRRTDNLNKAHQLYQMTIEAAGLDDWLPWNDILGMKANSRSTYEDVFGNKGSWGKADDIAKAGAKVLDILQKFIENVQSSINTIKAMNSQFEAEALEVLRRTRSTEEAMKEMARLQKIEEEKRRAIEEAKRQAELEAQRKIEEEKRRAELEKQRAIEEERIRREAQERARAEFEALRAKEEAERIQYKKPETLTGEEAMARQEAFDNPFDDSMLNPDPLAEEPAKEEDPKMKLSFWAELTTTQALELKKFFNDRNIAFGPVK